MCPEPDTFGKQFCPLAHFFPLTPHTLCLCSQTSVGLFIKMFNKGGMQQILHAHTYTESGINILITPRMRHSSEASQIIIGAFAKKIN